MKLKAIKKLTTHKNIINKTNKKRRRRNKNDFHQIKPNPGIICLNYPQIKPINTQQIYNNIC